MGGQGSTSADWMNSTVVCACIKCSHVHRFNTFSSQYDASSCHYDALASSYHVTAQSNHAPLAPCLHPGCKLRDTHRQGHAGIFGVCVQICKNGGYRFHQGSILQTCQSLATYSQQSVCQHCKAVKRKYSHTPHLPQRMSYSSVLSKAGQSRLGRRRTPCMSAITFKVASLDSVVDWADRIVKIRWPTAAACSLACTKPLAMSAIPAAQCQSVITVKTELRAEHELLGLPVVSVITCCNKMACNIIVKQLQVGAQHASHSGAASKEV